ncbi:MAG: type II secretion system F family protein [Sulfurimonas sp.]|jgi:general secretion pathway protein F|nr:type II secretion system F family protein [Sulfurimonas sp.]
MKYFIATVLTKGKREEIPLYAKDRKEANDYAKLKHSGIIIKVVEGTEPLEAQLKRFKANFFQNIKKRKIRPNAQIAAIRQLAVMTNAGISIHDSLSEIAASTDDQALKHVFGKLADDINAGHSLSASMENFRFELGNLSIAMVQLGEKTGNLDEALYSLADMLEEIRANVTKFKKAMAYPRNVMIAMAIAFTVLI